MIGTMTRLGQSHRGYSQREKVVRFLLLRPGWHSIHAIHREVGFCRLNSRVAEARKVFRRDGHPFDIVHSIRDGVHGYELVPLAEGGAVDRPTGDPGRVRSDGPLPASGSNLVSQADPDSHDEDGSLECMDNPALPCPERFGTTMRLWCENCVETYPQPIHEGQGQLL